MSAYYFDPSATVKWYIVEAGADVVDSLLDHEAGNVIYTAAIGEVEVIASLSRRGRIGDSIRTEVLEAIRAFREDFSTRWRIIETTPGLYDLAVDLAQKHFLRGYDAVHLAAARKAANERREAGLSLPTLVSSDSRLIAAANAEGFSTQNPIETTIDEETDEQTLDAETEE